MPQFLATMLKYALILFIIGMVVNFFISRIKEIVLVERTYVDLTRIISFEGFSFERYYNDEVNVLQPRLEALGFSEIEWMKGEADSFGPLTRVCKARSSEGEKLYFVYG